ncbi:MAG: HAD family hydrolase [bacterium]
MVFSRQNPHTLVTDLDNTLFIPDTEELPDGIFPRLNLWKQTGHRWIINTGRPIFRMEEFLAEWPVWPDYFVARERYIFQCVKKTTFAFGEWNRFMEERTRQVEQPPHFWFESWCEKENLKAEFENHDAIFDRVESARKAEEYLSELMTNGEEPIRNRVYLGVVPSEVGKGRCLKRIFQARSWSSGGAWVVGDSANDRDMLSSEYNFRSFAVENAEPDIKQFVRESGGTVLDEPGGRAIVKLLDWLL